MKKRLQAIDIQPYQMKDGETRYKVLFLDEFNKAYTGFTETPEKYKALVVDTELFDDAHAREYDVTRSEFSGKLSYRVFLP